MPKVELKAQSALTGADEAQLINYLKATGFHRGLLINFGAASLQYRRLVFGYKTPLKSACTVRRHVCVNLRNLWTNE